MRTEALVKSLEVNAVDDATLIGLLILALNARNVSIQTHGSGHATRTKLVQSITEGGRLSHDVERLRVVARQTLANVLSCSLGHGDSGLPARIAGDAIGADAHLGNMATEEFLSCLSKTAIERVGSSLNVLPRQRVKDTRAAVIAEAAGSTYIHPAAPNSACRRMPSVILTFRRSIRPVRRQIREPTRLNAPSIRHPHHHRLNPTAINRLQNRLTGRALPRTPPSRRGAAANEHRHGRGGDPCGQSPRLASIALRLLQDQPFLAFRQKRSRHLLCNPRDQFLDRLLRPDARKTSSLRRLVRHRERVRARLDHPFDPTPIGFTFSTRPLQQRLKIAERRKIGLTRLLNRLQKRTHELTFQRIDMHTPIERRPLDPRDLLRETEVTTPYGRRSLVSRRPLSNAKSLHSAHGSHPPVPVA